MGWKEENKGSGPWEFAPQQNKWGYLNNPRWLDPPTVPVNYDGREDEEPQVWDIESGSPIADKTSLPMHTHIPCGHWHKPVVLPPSTPPPTSPPIPPVSDDAWQQSIDVGDDGLLYIGFICYAQLEAFVAALDPTTGATLRFDNYINLPTVVDGVNFDLINPYMSSVRQESSYSGYLLHMINDPFYSALSLTSGISIGGYYYWSLVHTVPNYQYFSQGANYEIFDNGRMAACFTVGDPPSLRSTLYVANSIDYGNTWNVSVIDDEDNSLYYWNSPYLCKYNNVLYMIDWLVDLVDGINRLYLFISNDYGASWSTNLIITDPLPNTYSVLKVQCTVNSTGIYVFLTGKDNKLYCLKGWTWSPSNVSGVISCYSAMSTSAGIIIGATHGGGHFNLYKSINGISWSSVFDLNAAGLTTGITTSHSLRGKGDTMVFTHCRMGYPGAMKYVLSVDGGNNWSVVSTEFLTS